MLRLRLVLTATLGSALLLSACGKTSEPAPRQISVQTEPVTPARFSDYVDTISTLEAIEEVSLAAQAGGRVQKLLVKQGDVVQKGQLLLVLDQAQLQAEVAALTGQRDESRLNFQRFEYLARQGAASIIQRDALRQNYVAAEAALRAKRADLAYKDLRAPIKGVISDLKVKAGDVIQAGTPFTKVVRNDRLMARIDVPGVLTDRVRPGLPVLLQEPQGAKVLAQGVVSSVDPIINPSTQALLVKAEFPNATGALRNGLRLRTRLQLDSREQLSVPFAAVTQSSGQSFVFAVGSLKELERRPGKAKIEELRKLPPTTIFALQRPVQLGALQNNRYPVLNGLTAGDRVITSNLLALRHGMPVTVK